LKPLLSLCAQALPIRVQNPYPAGPPVATVGAEVDVVGDPPAPIYETAPPSPGVDFVWIGGAWIWQGSWVWEKGRWAKSVSKWLGF